MSAGDVIAMADILLNDFTTLAELSLDDVISLELLVDVIVLEPTGQLHDAADSLSPSGNS
jgi:hypothetical protein